ncbi:hypothetical protein BMW22_41115 (plasmid) [Rhizobium leguminosarum]|uniref:Uncharacterized protein n=1 Tax=Rhizobium leguminosarum TaxID=384 RepID=A0A1L3ZPX3_RHILE|nr:hypothetical protein BMW22_41115 [Rhizobium leguminosarum]
MAQVHYDEGVASHIGPEPCAGLREGVCEASVGEHTGQPLSRERMFFRAPTLSTELKAIRVGVQSRASVWPGVVADPGMYGSSLYGNREISWSAMTPFGADGPQREGEEP